MTSKAWWVVLLLVPAAAQAQLYKCKGPDGKVVYSDTRCEGSDKGTLKVQPNSSTPSEREKAMAEKAAAEADAARQSAAEADRQRGMAPAAAPPGAAVMQRPQPYELTSSDRERIRELEMTAGSLGASPEQKEAARFEISQIRTGRDAALSGDSRSRRDSLRTDLSSADAKKRRQVLQDFRAIYY